ncbi:hybrid sensor histidine kinase/response regulator [Pleurocapsa sp. PCC 7319]|uniref:hybrid sensor histidine kinase/response regulator n=1 Tax=Pleurocapsa sp. PCC 7319 TaxID=118161 RepID=UPI00034D4F60|nr:hybrid sensor histidine kinase/response regulator [Pleurocapsa sp. PCC 7319]
MDIEQQIRLNFLDEAEEYFDRMESSLIGLANNVIDPQKVDLVLRSAHSIKGGAAMMNYDVLSRVAHRLEDFLKILRVRYASSQITTEVETLFLQSVDCLRHICELSRRGVAVTESDVAARSQPIFEQLHQHLGDLEEGDENALLTAQDEDIDPAVLIFEEGVDAVLDRFEEQLSNLNLAQLAQELSTTAKELSAFGQMANLEPFIELCQSIQQQAQELSPEQIESLAQNSLNTWRRSHALVLRGRLEKLPSQLEMVGVSDRQISPTSPRENPDSQIKDDISSTLEALDLSAGDFDPFLEDFAASEALDELQSAFETEIPEVPVDLDTSDRLLTSEIEEFAVDEIAEAEADLDPFIEEFPESEALSELQSAFETEISEVSIESDAGDRSLTSEIEEFTAENLEEEYSSETDGAFDVIFDDSVKLENITELRSAFDVAMNEVSVESESSERSIIPENNAEVTNSQPASQQKSPAMDKMVRVPASQLRQFNNLFEQLVLERNNLNLRFKQLQSIAALMRRRIEQIERSNTNLKQWYDRASVEGFLTTEQAVATSVISAKKTTAGFDALEMDRYTDVHLICQEQIETIVQLQEVATDVELGLQDINLAVRDLNHVTKFLQSNVIRTQMLPFAEVVKRFPRVIRDLNLQFGKKVNLKIEGENTLIDRSVLESLNDPLLHLLRNAFDHGIEDAATRTAAGKLSEGTITLQANNQGTQTVITLSDDGGGIPLDKIRDRIQAMGLPREHIQQMPETEILDFIFEPGFSTAKQVTELSGRGVGMDVVRTNLQDIRGNVSVATKPGLGTTFTLKIPFSLSILRVAIVEKSGIIFAIPANTIQELLPLNPEAVTTSENIKHITWKDEQVPLVQIEKALVLRRSHNTFNLTDNPMIDRPMAILVGDKEKFAGLEISRFWGEQEATIRPIESPIPLPPGVVSSMVFGDGRVIPLIDPSLLIEDCLKRSSAEESLGTTLLEQDSQPSALATDRQTILVVDDSINVRRYLSVTLEKAGYKVQQAKDGQEAVDKLIDGLSVQGVVCDIEMPRLDGYGVLEELRDKTEFRELPIVMLTSRSNEKHRKLAMNLGASAYFSKPYNEQELLQKIAELIQIYTH